nr:LarC family nickel insertion protein [Lachnospiraceae bacterium]
MKILYLDLGMGAAGDMLSAALYELLDENEKKEYLDKMRALLSIGIEIKMRKDKKCGITGTHMDVYKNG